MVMPFETGWERWRVWVLCEVVAAEKGEIFYQCEWGAEKRNTRLARKHGYTSHKKKRLRVGGMMRFDLA